MIFRIYYKRRAYKKTVRDPFSEKKNIQVLKIKS